jgi:ATP-dependent Lhr-like helicase
MVVSVISELHKLDLKGATEKAVERSGIFKRRLIHAGKKCGAIAKDADYASVSISGIIEALRDTPVYEEAMSVIFHDDFDLHDAVEIVEKINDGAIEVKLVEYDGLTPIARIGVEEISRRGEIVSPERLRALLKQSTRARVNDTFLVAVCTNCWNFLELRKVGDLEGLQTCPVCGKTALGLSSDSYENVFSLAMKARSRTDLRGSKLRAVEALKKTSLLRKDFGHAIDMLFAGRGVRLAEAAALASKMRKEGTDVVELIIEGEREALRRRYFFAGS